MPRLFNLESRTDCYRYAHAFGKNGSDLVPQPTDRYATAYLKFLEEHQHHHFLEIQPAPSNILQLALSPRCYQTPGKALGEDKEPFLIIPDTLTPFQLSQEPGLKGKRYIYSSAFHYWNHYRTFQQHDLSRPVLFINLEGFNTQQRLVPITFRCHRDYGDYGIPIITNIRMESLPKSPQSIGQYYDRIYEEVTNEITERVLASNQKHLASELRDHLIEQLRSFSPSRIVNCLQTGANIEIPLVIPFEESISYRTSRLSYQRLAEILHLHFPALESDLKQLENYQIAIIFGFNHLPAFRDRVTRAGWIPLTPGLQDFPSIWQQKQTTNLPLYGFNLDILEFKIQMDGREEWLRIPSENQDAVSWEGESRSLVATLPSGKTYFKLGSNLNEFSIPIKVNGADYFIDGVKQEFKAVVQGGEQRGSDIIVQIQFKIEPGKPPSLSVQDIENRYMTDAFLAEVSTSTDAVRKLGFIPLERIIQNREKEVQERMDVLLDDRGRVTRICSKLNQLTEDTIKIGINKEEMEKIIAANLRSLLQDLRYKGKGLSSREKDLLQYLDPSQEVDVVIRLRQLFQEKGEILFKHLEKCLQNDGLGIGYKGLLLNFLGRTYKFSTLFFNTSSRYLRISSIDKKSYIDLRYGLIIRTCSTSNLQGRYFDAFEQHCQSREYLWGYNRILMWYCNFPNTGFINYRGHFQRICQHLLENPQREDKIDRNSDGYHYAQDALSALIYLLTFRESDSDFCQKNSVEFRLVNRVINAFGPIKLNAVSKQKTLNQILKELLEEQSTEEIISSLISASSD